MRKSTKLVVLVAALVALFSLTAFAATKKGWVAEDGKWYFYDNNGDKVSQTFKQDQGRWFYLDDDYAMATNKLIEFEDNYYYVGADGARVTGDWVKVAATDDDESGAEFRYYYFLSSGKAVKGTSKKINGKTYYFDEDGKMLFGYVLSNAMINSEEDAILKCDHYYGAWNDGAMVSGWYEYKDGFTAASYDSSVWFYFASGTKTVSTENKLINKKYYSFGDDGVMVTGFKKASGSETERYFYNADGQLTKSAWVRKTLADTAAADSEKWFYLNSDGKITKDSQVIVVKKKYYALDKDGVMQAGLVELDKADIRESGIKFKAAVSTSKTATQVKADYGTNLYYFSGDEATDGSAKTGTIKIDLADAEYTFVFNKYTYKANHGIVDGILYDHGMLQAAGTYGVKSSAGNKFFVNSKGSVITKTNKYTDGDGNVYVVDGERQLLYKIPATDYYNNATKKYDAASKVASNLLTVVKKTGNEYITAKDAFDAAYDKDFHKAVDDVLFAWPKAE